MENEEVRDQDAINAFRREVEENLEALATAHRFRELSAQWLRASLPYRYSYNFTSLGRPIIQYPQDMVATHELIWSVRPDVVIETGVAHGGSLIHSASALALLDYCDAARTGAVVVPSKGGRRVMGIDIEIRPHNREAIEQHPLAHKIDLITGSSVAPDVVRRVRNSIRADERVLVLLDSNHTHEHVYAELQAYAPLVSPGSYCVVFDTVIDELPPDQFPDRSWGPQNNPLTAVKAYLADLSGGAVVALDATPLAFEVDSRIDSKLMISVARGGYLRRI